MSSLLLVPAIALSLGLFVPLTVNAAPAAGSSCGTGFTGGLQAGADCSKTNQSNVPTTLLGSGGVFTTIVNILLYIIAAIAVIMLIIGGIRYVTSGGNSAAVTGAKNTILYAVIGIIIAVLAYAIVNFVLGALLNT